MSKIKSIVAAAAMVLSLPTIAGAAERPEGQAGAVDPRAFPALTVIYSAAGVLDNGAAANTGVATSFLCTNWTAATQKIRFLLRNTSGTVVANSTNNVAGLTTFTASTHLTTAFLNELGLSSAGTPISPGSVRIFATTPQITCTAIIIDASTAVPYGVPLHLVRHNAWPNTQE